MQRNACWICTASLLVLSSGDRPDTDTLKPDKKGWASLCPALKDLQAELPSYVVRLGHAFEEPYRPGEAGNCSEDSTGPWRVKVDLNAPEGVGEAFQKPHRMVLTFSPEWPFALPDIRFLGYLRSVYAESDTKGFRIAEATELLQTRLREQAGKEACRWRQSSDCAADGSKLDPDNVRLCSKSVELGESGFCDCNGDGKKGKKEPGYNCKKTPGTCDRVCKGKRPLPLYNLREIFNVLHKSLGKILDMEDLYRFNSVNHQFHSDVVSSILVTYAKLGKKHPMLFQNGLFAKDIVNPELLRTIKAASEHTNDPEAARARLLESGLVTEVVKDAVYSFPVLIPNVQELLKEELQHVHEIEIDLPAEEPLDPMDEEIGIGRPRSGPNQEGINVNNIGLEPLMFVLQDSVIQPMATMLLPTKGIELEAQHAFTLRHTPQDEGWGEYFDRHTDESDITFNLNLEASSSGTPLIFCGVPGKHDHRHFKAAHEHLSGHAVLHLGGVRHGPEAGSQFLNLVVWSYSRKFRAARTQQQDGERESGPPDKRCVSYVHDRDFGHVRDWPEGTQEKFLGEGWCPHEAHEYEGFRADKKESG